MTTPEVTRSSFGDTRTSQEIRMRACFYVVYRPSILPISFRITSLTLGQSYDFGFPAYSDGLAQDCGNASALARELLKSSSKPLISASLDHVIAFDSGVLPLCRRYIFSVNRASPGHHQTWYRKTSNISRTKSQNSNVSNLVLQLSLLNPLKPGVKSRMKM